MSSIALALSRQGGFWLAAAMAFLAAAVAYALALRPRASRWMGRAGSMLVLVGFVLATGLLAMRWMQAGRPPFKTLSESLLLFAWCTALTHLMVERFCRMAWLALLSCSFIVLLIVYGGIKADAQVMSLPPALQSAWFIPHVVVYFFGYAALFMAFIGALVHLWRPELELERATPAGQRSKVSYAHFMDMAIHFGFVLLTLGLVIGAIWAKQAWGDYWTWDPKENWALISWLVFVLHLHLRHSRRITDRASAVLVIIGFATIVFTYLGMNLLPTAGQSVHVYQ